MPGPEVWKLYIWSRVSLIWKWCFMEKTVTDEESASPLYYKTQLSVRLVLPSTITLTFLTAVPGFLLPAGLSVHAKPLFNSPELSLGPACACPSPPSQSGPAPELPQKPSLQNPRVQRSVALSVEAPWLCLSFSELHLCLGLSLLGWQYSQGDRTISLQSSYSLWGYILSGIII